jgi:hypothetical protein
MELERRVEYLEGKVYELIEVVNILSDNSNAIREAFKQAKAESGIQ